MINNNDKFGLALCSGAARGLTHIGVLKAIDEIGIKLNYIAGSSIGAMIGGAYALGIPVKEIENIALQTDWKLMAKIFAPSLSLSSFANSNYLNEFLKTIFGDSTFNDLKIPFTAVSTDIISGKAVRLNEGDLLSAIRASISIPVIFSPVSLNGLLLIDGGLTNPIPVDVLKDYGITKIIAVNLKKFNYPIESNIDNHKIEKIENTEINKMTLNEKIQYFIKNPLELIQNSKSAKTNDPKFWNILYQIFIIVQVQIAEFSLQLAEPDILIEPDVTKFKVFDFSKAKQLINIGYNTAIKKFSKII